MSYITLPDPFLGRCMNYRPSGHLGEARRCLEYESERHVCTFAPIEHKALGLSQSFGIERKPDQWVKP